MPDAQHIVGFAFMVGVLVGLGAAAMVAYESDALHPRNNKQYSPPSGESETEDDIST